MTLHIYDDTTHQAVPTEPTKEWVKSLSIVYGLGIVEAKWRINTIISAAPLHVAKLPTREEIARTIARADYGYEVEPAKWRYEAADAILALIQKRMKP